MIGFVLINEFGRRDCPPAQKQTAADLYNVISATVVSPTVSHSPTFCDGDDPNPQVVAAFNGPSSAPDVVAAYRRHAAEVGWREGMAIGSLWLCFDGALADGTRIEVQVSPNTEANDGTAPAFFVTGFYSGGPMNVAAYCHDSR
ncbi:hypothetical protein [Catenulispora yoronensis]|uniref:hypothetical protein n=1 Tax=Catenulispora yoronensis TaxID=450799 RepID=UPI0031D052AC